MKREMSKWTEY